jgi:hypothetical protein
MCMTTEENQIHMLCNIYGEYVGSDKANWGDGLLKKYPNHRTLQNE